MKDVRRNEGPVDTSPKYQVDPTTTGHITVAMVLPGTMQNSLLTNNKNPKVNMRASQK